MKEDTIYKIVAALFVLVLIAILFKKGPSSANKCIGLTPFICNTTSGCEYVGIEPLGKCQQK